MLVTAISPGEQDKLKPVNYHIAHIVDLDRTLGQSARSEISRDYHLHSFAATTRRPLRASDVDLNIDRTGGLWMSIVT